MTDRLIEDYALIGDCETAALVSLAGSIDWLCWPRFDSDACFAALLGGEEHGHWRIAPQAATRTTRRYRPGTLILETRFETEDGTAILIDFMPPRGLASDVVRIVVGESGTVRLRMCLALRFGYGRVIPWVNRHDDGSLVAVAGPDLAVLRTPAEFRGEGMSTVAEFTIRAGERVPFALTYGQSHEPLPDPIDPEAELSGTETFWAEWSARYRPPSADCDAALPPAWREAIRRSLIVLKALTYAPTGGTVAAATTSLPEWIGGTRNWDYRYCWLRDSSIMLFAFLNSGYFDEAKAWRDWMIRAMAGSVDQLQIMYGLSGERRLPEWQADWLPGFQGSAPVRIGNAAESQLQLDVYGEVMNLLHHSRQGGMAESRQAWSLQCAMLNQLKGLWRDPDEGIWEVRGPRRHFTFSKAMAWVAFDRCIKSSEEFGLDDVPIAEWRTIRDEIHATVCDQGFDTGRNSFVQSFGAKDLDASLLLLPMMGFIPADDPRFLGTVAAIEQDLIVEGFVRRYRTSEVVDGLPVGEGAFLACSFWLVTAYVLTGRLDDAKALFERLLAIRNDVGLLAEEYDAKGKRQLGNVPQAFSHVALVHAGHRLAEAMAKASTSSS